MSQPLTINRPVSTLPQVCRTPAVRVIVDVLEREPGKPVLVVSRPDRSLDMVPISVSGDEGSSRWQVGNGAKSLAVRIEVGDDSQPACSVLVATKQGPQRVELHVAAALSLVRSGVHGVVTRRTSVSGHEG